MMMCVICYPFVLSESFLTGYLLLSADEKSTSCHNDDKSIDDPRPTRATRPSAKAAVFTKRNVAVIAEGGCSGKRRRSKNFSNHEVVDIPSESSDIDTGKIFINIYYILV